MADGHKRNRSEHQQPLVPGGTQTTYRLSGPPAHTAETQTRGCEHPPYETRPELAEIIAAVADHFGVDPAEWTCGRRSNDAARAVAAFLARRRFGYPAGEIAAALGYRDHSGVGRAIRRVEHPTAKLKRDVKKLETALNP